MNTRLKIYCIRQNVFKPELAWREKVLIDRTAKFNLRRIKRFFCVESNFKRNLYKRYNLSLLNHTQRLHSNVYLSEVKDEKQYYS